MQNNQFQPKGNPLAGYMRQPKIYISLPSQGNFWPTNSIHMTETGEFPVFSMTAKDELTFKTPDALLNGQGIVDVIQSCIPNIKNAWDIPTIDLDTILIAIRLATYGEKMPIKIKIPVINEEVELDIDLRVLLDQQQQNQWIDQIVINPDFIIYVRPLTYKHMTQVSIKSFETTRILNLVNDDSLSEEKKIEMFNNSFKNLTNVTVNMMSQSIYKIVVNDEEVTSQKYIEEFVSNSDKTIFDKVQEHLSQLKTHNELKPLIFNTSAEQQEQGAPSTVSVPVNFNNSDFFGQGF